MGIHKYNLEGRVADILIGSELHWYATCRLGLDIFVGKDLSKVDTFSVYVPLEEETAWKNYLASKNATSTERTPNLNIIVSDDYSMMTQAILEHTLRLSKVARRYRRQEQESYETLLMLEQEANLKGLQPRYSCGTPQTHLVPKKRLEEDGRRFASRYLSNVYTEQHNKEPRGNVYLRHLRPVLGWGNC